MTRAEIIPLALVMASVVTAACGLWIVRKDRFLTMVILLTYVIWHLPIVLTAALPLDVPIRSSANLPYTVMILALIHLIVVGGVAGYLVAGRRSQVRRPVQLRFGWHFIVLAYLGAIFVAVDAFVFRTSFSLDLGANRAAYSNVESASIFGQIGILLGGLALYLLLAKPFGLRTLVVYGAPYFVNAVTQMLVGNRQFMLMGLILLVLTYLASRRPPVMRTVITGSIVAVVFLVLMVGFGAARQTATKGVQDLALASLMKVEVLDYDHPLTSSYGVRTAALYLYVYYGIEYDMAASIMRDVDIRVPVLSLTAPIVYRRFSPLLGLPDQAAVMRRIAEEVESIVGVYPNVWATMFTQAYYEGGRAGVLVFGVTLAVLNFVLTWRMVRTGTNIAINAVTIFYACLIFGIQFFPTRDGAITALILFSVAIALLNTLAPGAAHTKARRAEAGGEQLHG